MSGNGLALALGMTGERYLLENNKKPFWQRW